MNQLLKKISDVIINNYRSNNSGYIEEYICDILMKYMENSGDINLYESISSNSFASLIYKKPENVSIKPKNKDTDRGSLKYNLLKNNKKFLRTFPKIINVNKCNYNYNEYKIFYTWDDFIEIKNECVSNIKKLFINDSETEDDTDENHPIQLVKTVKDYEPEKHIIFEIGEFSSEPVVENNSGMTSGIKIKNKKQSIKLWNKIKKTLMKGNSTVNENVRISNENVNIESRNKLQSDLPEHTRSPMKLNKSANEVIFNNLMDDKLTFNHTRSDVNYFEENGNIYGNLNENLNGNLNRNIDIDL